ncbi:MAG: hypothetical protein HY395_02060 [Candidatus Doudnabacteria bacterium]|nr:hypothetical protein [Candidatus Doudnabacteria bacterium]
MPTQIIKDFITLADLKKLAEERFGDMIKTVVDIEEKIMAVGGDLHSDQEALLLTQGSKQENLWGINIYIDQPRENWVEFDSMINLRPSQGNKSRSIENEELRKKITEIVNSLIK